MSTPEQPPRDSIVFDGLIVPACSLVPGGKWLTPNELRDLLQEYGKADPEAGHAFIDDLMRAALEAIRDAEPGIEAQKLAAAVLYADTADFPRWCA